MERYLSITNALPFQSFETISLRQHSFSAYFDHIFKTPEENVLRTTPQKNHITDWTVCLIINTDNDPMLKHEHFQNSQIITELKTLHNNSASGQTG